MKCVSGTSVATTSFSRSCSEAVSALFPAALLYSDTTSIGPWAAASAAAAAAAAAFAPPTPPPPAPSTPAATCSAAAAAAADCPPVCIM